jgi:NAD(P)-dependent dehydrogenase (short-subunit alcohol dehydrogenase family)
LERQVVLVTGANRNTGFGIAKAFLDAGAVVFLHARTIGKAREAAAKLGDQARAVAADLQDEAAIDEMFGAVREQAGRLDALVNNACHLGLGYAALDTPLSYVDEVFSVNVRAVLQCCRCAARLMMETGGAIVNVGSNAANRAIRDRAAYVASKGAVAALTRALAVEWGAYGIRVNLLTPGYIRTDRWDDLPAETIDRRRANLPLGREATPADIGNAAVFLTSPASGNTTGTELVMDGGAEAQLVPPDAEV